MIRRWKAQVLSRIREDNPEEESPQAATSSSSHNVPFIQLNLSPPTDPDTPSTSAASNVATASSSNDSSEKRIGNIRISPMKRKRSPENDQNSASSNPSATATPAVAANLSPPGAETPSSSRNSLRALLPPLSQPGGSATNSGAEAGNSEESPRKRRRLDFGESSGGSGQERGGAEGSGTSSNLPPQRDGVEGRGARVGVFRQGTDYDYIETRTNGNQPDG